MPVTPARALAARDQVLRTMAERRDLLRVIPDLGDLSPLLVLLHCLPGVTAEIRYVTGPTGAQQCVAVVTHASRVLARRGKAVGQ